MRWRLKGVFDAGEPEGLWEKEVVPSITVSSQKR